MPWSAGTDAKRAALQRLSEPEILRGLRGVVDLGAGAGVWRELAATYPVGQLPWIAVEAHFPYVRRFRLRQRYDVVRHRRMESVSFGAYAGHAFIFGDVLEHVGRMTAADLIWRSASVGVAVVMMPFLPTTSELQDGAGVEAERHRYVWEWDEWLGVLATLGLRVEVIAAPPGMGRNKGCVLCRAGLAS